MKNYYSTILFLSNTTLHAWKQVTWTDLVIYILMYLRSVVSVVIVLATSSLFQIMWIFVCPSYPIHVAWWPRLLFLRISSPKNNQISGSDYHLIFFQFHILSKRNVKKLNPIFASFEITFFLVNMSLANF